MTGSQPPGLPSGDKRRRLILAVALVALFAAAVVVFILVTRDDSASNDTTEPSATTTASANSTSTIGGQPSRGAGQPQQGPTTATKRAPIRRSLDSSADLGKGIRVQVESIDAVRGKARGIGEVAGPAIRTTIRVTNNGSGPIKMDLGLVNLYYGSKDIPADPLSGPGVVPFPAEVRSGKSGTARLVFAVPRGMRDKIKIEFSYSVAAPRAIFTGSVSDV